MSFVTTAEYADESLKIEITRNGEIIFLDRDIEYELAMVEFGEHKTQAVMLFEKWRDGDIYVITENLPEIKKELITLFAADCAEHVVTVYEAIAGYNKKAASDAIRSARCELGEIEPVPGISSPGYAGNIAMNQANVLFKSMADHIGGARFAASKSAEAAARVALAALALEHKDDYKWCSEIIESLHSSRAAGAYSVSWKQESTEYSIAYQEERLWQIRRLVDLVNASGTENTKPPLEATK